jgi:hypothetical protein
MASRSTLAGDEDDVAGQLAELLTHLVLEEGEEAVGVALRLVVGHEDHVLAPRQLLLDAEDVFGAVDGGVVPVDHGPREVDAEGLVVEEARVGRVRIGALEVHARVLLGRVPLEVVRPPPLLADKLRQKSKVLVHCEFLRGGVLAGLAVVKPPVL